MPFLSRKYFLKRKNLSTRAHTVFPLVKESSSRGVTAAKQGMKSLDAGEEQNSTNFPATRFMLPFDRGLFQGLHRLHRFSLYRYNNGELLLYFSI